MALVHRCRFFEWVPDQIICLCANATDLFAVGRINGDIEIWNPNKDKFYSGKKITGQSGQSLRCLTWGKGDGAQRLFSGVDLGYIYEWNLVTLQQETSSDSYGGWVHSLSVNKDGTKLAAGTAGGVSIFDISGGGLSYKEIIRFEAKGDRRYEQAASFKLDTKVASLLVLPDSTVVIGTTKGGVQMWNGKMRVQVATFNEHQTTVVALASNSAGDTVYASGGDPKICMFKKIGPAKWVYSSHQRRHTHDVSSLVVMKDRIISGSSDTMIIFYNEHSFKANATVHGIQKVLPFPHAPVFDLASEARLVLYRTAERLELWRLGSAVSDATTEGQQVLPVGTHPIKLLDMELNKDRHYLRASAISPNGKYIACASVKSVKLFKLEYNQDTVTVEPVELPDVLIPHKLTLTNTHLVLANTEYLQILDLGTLASPLEFTLSNNNEDYNPAPINTLVTSNDGAFAAVGDMKNNIHVFDLQNLKHTCTLPKLQSQHTALSFQPNSSALAFVDVTGRFHMYDYKKKAFTPWSQSLPPQLPSAYTICAAADPVVGISFDPARPATMILWASKFVAAVNINEEDVLRPVKRSKGEEGNSGIASTVWVTINVLGRYSDVMYTGFVEGERQSGLVVVERPWLDIIPHLPNVFDLKLFGR